MNELERFKREINLVEYVSNQDYTEIDKSRSSRTCLILRRQSDNGKIAVSRSNEGHFLYYDFRCGRGGSIIDFVMHHTGSTLGQTRKRLRQVLGGNVNSFSPPPIYRIVPSPGKNRQKIDLEYAETNPLERSSAYLESRGIGVECVLDDRFAGSVREDRYGNVCFPYFDFDAIVGIEKRNHNFKHYSKGGRKGLWKSNLKKGDSQTVICESPIDALSYAKLHCHEKERTRYLALGGQISRFQWELIDGVIKKYRLKSIRVVLAFDNDAAGKRYVQQFQERYSGSSFNLSLPPREGLDWNFEQCYRSLGVLEDAGLQGLCKSWFIVPLNDVLKEQSSRRMTE